MTYYILSFILLGVASLTFQILTLREFLVLFSGNEISIGIFLSIWMIFVGIGSCISGSFLHKTNRKLVYVWIVTLVSVLMPPGIIVLRFLKQLMQMTPLEALGPFHIIIFSLICIAPLCILFGMWFTYGSRIVARAGKVYYYESIGSVLSGILLTAILIRYFSYIDILAVISIFNFIVLYLILVREEELRNNILKYVVITCFTAYGILVITGLNKTIDRLSNSFRWKPFELIESENTFYGNLSVIKLQDEYTFYQNNNRLFSTSIAQEHNEELVHFGMLVLSCPGKVLLLGGGPAGNLYELFKYKIEKAVYVEVDPAVIDISKKYISPKDKQILNSPKLTVINADARAFVNYSDEQFDCVILDAGDPTTGLLNRYYTVEFFRKIKKMLSPGGVFVFSLSSLENYMTDELKLLSSSVHKGVEETFSYSTVLPGTRNYFIVSDSKFKHDPGFYIKRMKQENIKTTHLTSEYVRYLLRADRVNRTMKWITEKAQTRANTDYNPVSYFYGLMYWTSQFSKSLSQGLLKDNMIKIYGFALILMIFVVILKLKKRLSNLVIMGLISFASILVELLIIFIFQVKYGSIYYEIGILLASGMAGLALGSFMPEKILINLYNIKTSIIVAESLMLALIILIVNVITSIDSKFIYLLFILFSAMPVGAVFSLSGRIIEKNRDAGILYGFDLWGAAAGSFLVTVFFIPVLGLIPVFYIAIISIVISLVFSL